LYAGSKTISKTARIIFDRAVVDIIIIFCEFLFRRRRFVGRRSETTKEKKKGRRRSETIKEKKKERALWK